MKSLVISLKTAVERRQHIEHEFGKQAIHFEFFDALTPDLAEPLAKQKGLNINTEFLSTGELACFMSHVSIWQKMVDENIPHLAVFEDDVHLGENAAFFLGTDRWLDQSFQIIKLEAFSKKILHENNGVKLEKDRALFKLKGRHVGAAGYILSLQAAQYLLDLLKNIKIIEPLDHILFDPQYHQKMALYQMKPALCIQSYLYTAEKQANLGSSLEDERIVRRKSESKARTLGEKFKRELGRFKKQMSESLNQHDIEFK